MLSFKIYKRILPVKKAWEHLIPENSCKIYQTYSFNQIVYLHYIRSGQNLIRRIRFGNKPIFVVAYENGEPVCIAPVFLFNKPAKVIRMIGYSTNAGYLDFVYKDGKYVGFLIDFLKKQYPNHDLEFTFVPEYSPLIHEGGCWKSLVILLYHCLIMNRGTRLFQKIQSKILEPLTID